jgi:conjugal transfer pilus assembly protein TrbC
MKWLMVVGGLVLSTVLMAQNSNGIPGQALLEKDDASQLKTSSLSNKQEHIAFINQLLQGKQQDKKGEPQQADGAILFVSFSMPDALLVSLSEEAHTYNIPLVIRGLVDNDFKKTLLRIQSLQQYAKERNQHFYGLSIDPLWFEQFKIEAVPALVLTTRSSNCQLQKLCPSQHFDVIYGNGSIEQSLQIISDKSEEFNIQAAHLLRRKNEV